MIVARAKLLSRFINKLCDVFGRKLSEKKTLKDKLRIEEIRGVFVLGLLAVLVSIRFGYKELLIYVGEPYFNLISGLIDITIVFWFLYAYLMVLGISEDVIGKNTRNYLKIYQGFFSKCISSLQEV
jgi:hypothetical protein